MPYIQCKKRKNWAKVYKDICFAMKCPYFEFTEYNLECTYSKGKPKRKRKEK